MGMFDDLIPDQPVGGGMFDDLVSDVPISNPTIDHLKKVRAELGGGFAAQQIDKSIAAEEAKSKKLADLRKSNPYLADEIESMSKAEASGVSFGRGLTDLLRPLGLADQEDAGGAAAVDALEDIQGTSGARTLGQMAPFAPLGGAVAMGSSLPAAASTAMYSALGGAEGYLSSAGEGKDPVIPTIAGVAAPLGANFLPAVTRSIQGVLKRRATDKVEAFKTLQHATPSEAVDEIYALAKTDPKNAVEKSKEIILNATKEHPALTSINKAINDGGDASAIAKAVEDSKVAAKEGVAAKYMLDGDKIKSNPKAKVLIDQGMKSQDVQLIASASKGDKSVFKRINAAVRGGLNNRAYANANHPQAIVGDSLLKRLNYVQSVNKKAGESIKQVAKQELSGKMVDLSDPVKSFSSKLDDMGVTYDKSAGKLNYENSALMDMPDLQNSINKVMSRLDPKRNTSVDALSAHHLKRWFDRIVDFSKSPKGGGMDAEIEHAIKQLRHDVNSELGNISSKYKEVNTTYSETVDAINDLRKVAGRNRDLSSEFADESLGMLARRVTSNAASRGQVKDSIKKLEDVAAKYGKSFDDSIEVQSQYVSALEDSLGAFSSTSLKGETQSVVERMASKTKSGILDDVYSAAKDQIKKLGKKDEQSFMDAIDSMLNE